MIDRNDCVICFEQIKLDDDYKCPECNNIIHKDCYNKWKHEGNELCPFCRRKYSMSSVDDEPKYCKCKKCLFIICYCMCILMCTIPYFILIPFLFYFGKLKIYTNYSII